MTVKNLVDLSVVIVTYKSKEFIPQCIRSIYEAAKGLSLEIIIVDNASEDDISDLVRAEFPDVIMIENKKNEGFARGVNQGAGMASGEYLCILNPDTQLYPKTLKILLDFLKIYPRDCIVGPHIVDGSGESNPSCRSLPHIINIIKYPISFLLRGNQLKKPRRYLLDIWNQSETIDSAKYKGYITGTCFITRLNFFKKMGGFDERYFLYCEDADLGLRIAQGGYNAFLIAEASMMHFAGRSAYHNPLAQLYFVEAYLHYIHKNFTFFHRVVYKTCFLSLIVGWALGAWLRRDRNQVKIVLQSLKYFNPCRPGSMCSVPEHHR
jgi:GT2 family glycosyltransferase